MWDVHPEWHADPNNREIARQLGVSYETVARARRHHELVSIVVDTGVSTTRPSDGEGEVPTVHIPALTRPHRITGEPQQVKGFNRRVARRASPPESASEVQPEAQAEEPVVAAADEEVAPPSTYQQRQKKKVVNGLSLRQAGIITSINNRVALLRSEVQHHSPEAMNEAPSLAGAGWGYDRYRNRTHAQACDASSTKEGKGR